MKLKEIIEKHNFPVEAQVVYPGDNEFLEKGSRVILLSHEEGFVLAQKAHEQEFISIPVADSSSKRAVGLPGLKSVLEEPDFIVIR